MPTSLYTTCLNVATELCNMHQTVVTKAVCEQRTIVSECVHKLSKLKYLLAVCKREQQIAIDVEGMKYMNQ